MQLDSMRRTPLPCDREYGVIVIKCRMLYIIVRSIRVFI